MRCLSGSVMLVIMRWGFGNKESQGAARFVAPVPFDEERSARDKGFVYKQVEPPLICHTVRERLSMHFEFGQL